MIQDYTAMTNLYNKSFHVLKRYDIFRNKNRSSTPLRTRNDNSVPRRLKFILQFANSLDIVLVCNKRTDNWTETFRPRNTGLEVILASLFRVENSNGAASDSDKLKFPSRLYQSRPAIDSEYKFAAKQNW